MNTISDNARQAASKLVSELPPDVLEHPMPFPVRLDYARKIAAKHIQSAMDAATADKDKVIEKAAALVEKMLTVHDSPEFKSVWVLAQMHGDKYSGPTYSKEFAGLRDALAALHPEEKRK